MCITTTALNDKVIAQHFQNMYDNSWNMNLIFYTYNIESMYWLFRVTCAPTERKTWLNYWLIGVSFSFFQPIEVLMGHG